MKKSHILGAATALILSGSAAAQASPLYDNITNDTHIAELQTAAALFGVGGYIANEFSVSCPTSLPGCTYTLGNITLALQDYTGSKNGVYLQVLANATFNSDVAAGTIPTPNEYTLVPSTIPQSLSPTTFTPINSADPRLTLTAGNYWAVLTYTGGDALSWGYDSGTKQLNPGQPNLLNYNDGSGNFYSGSYGLLMQVQATSTQNVGAIPLPGSAWLMGTVLMGMATSRFRKSRI